jgi:hypothetical protein
MNKGLSIEWRSKVSQRLDLDQAYCNVLTGRWTSKFVKNAMKRVKKEPIHDLT